MHLLIKMTGLLAMTTLMTWCAGLLVFTLNVTTLEQATTAHPKTEAIIVLTGAQGRIEEGFYLFATKRAPKLFISGVNKETSLNDLKKRWQGAPLPACCVELGYVAQNTMGNALESAAWARQNKVNSLFLVTSDYHMPRATLEFSYAAPELKIYQHPVYPDPARKNSLKYMQLIIGEYHKTLLTYLRNLINPA